MTSPSGNEKPHICSICGKIYTYLVSYLKHLKLHNSHSDQPLIVKYVCSECGMSFVRHTCLVRHLKSHQKPVASKPPTYRCDQCRKEFSSAKKWRKHVKFHKENRFWCLNCAKGFSNEESLDRHLWVLHRNYYVPVKMRGEGLNTVTGGTIKNERVCGNSDLGDHDNSKKSDYGESEHNLKLSEPFVLTGAESLNKEPQNEEMLSGSESSAVNLPREPELLEWECVECDMSFDEEAKLHLHYIRHASGELLMPQDDFME